MRSRTGSSPTDGCWTSASTASASCSSATRPERGVKDDHFDVAGDRGRLRLDPDEGPRRGGRLLREHARACSLEHVAATRGGAARRGVRARDGHPRADRLRAPRHRVPAAQGPDRAAGRRRRGGPGRARVARRLVPRRDYRQRGLPPGDLRGPGRKRARPAPPLRTQERGAAMTDQQQATPAKLTKPSDREIHVERVFGAPRDRVFAAFTDPGRIPEWWGPRDTTTIVDRMDVRPGGSWRFVMRDSDGSESGFRGTYREVTPPERIVQTFEWEGMPGHVSVET